jgi:sugar lactone lactonase YvrE
VDARVRTDPSQPDRPDRIDDNRYDFVPILTEDRVLDRMVVRRGVTWWGLWAGIALLCGVVFRLIDLGAFTLGPTEGGYAFQGWAVFRGEGAYGPGGLPDTSPLVQLAEAFIFFLAGATDVIARLGPVAAGIGTLLLVFALGPVTRPGARVGMLFTIALSPSLVYFSRTVDPAIFIAFFTMLLIVAIARAGAADSAARLSGWSAIAGLAIGGLLASGPVGITAVLAGAIAVAISAVAAGAQARPDALGVGARRIQRTPAALILLVAAIAVTVLVLFTRLFSDLGAIAGVLDTFEEWGRILGTRPTTTPTQFFIWATLLYELVNVALMLIALLAAPLTPSPDGTPVLRGSTFATWFGVALVLQSLSSGRAPDQMPLVALPLAIAAGLGLGYLLERVEAYRLLSSLASLIPLAVLALVIGLIAILMAVARSNDDTITQTSGIQAVIIILLLVIVPFSLLLARAMTAEGEQTHAVGWSALLVVIAILGLYGVRNASMLSFERSDRGTELLAQETSTPGVTAFVDQVTRLSRDLSVGDATPADPTARYSLTIAVAPEIADPYRWYFRDFPDVRVTTAAGWSDADVVISPSPESMAEQGFIVQSRAQFNRVPPSYEGLEAGNIFSYIVSPSKWYDGIRFLLFRDNIAVPPPEQIAIGYTPELSNQINPALGPFNLDDSPGRGAALGQFDTPIGIDHTADGDVIFVVDSGNLRVERFTGDGEFIGVWDANTDPNLAFAEAFDIGPTGIAVSNEDLVYIADTWNHRVVVVDRSGTFVREIGQRGGQTDTGDNPDPNVETGRFFGPRGIAIDSGEIFVTDTGNERVQVFASDGTFLRAFGGYGTEPGKLLEPVGIAVGPDGRVYVADSGNQRLSIFERDGTPVTQVPIPSWEGQTTLENYLAFGPDALLYMTAPDAGVVDVYDPLTGQIVLTTQGSVDAPMDQPVGITVMPDGEVLVTDTGLNDVVRFTPEVPERAAPPAASPVASPAASVASPAASPMASPAASPAASPVSATPEPVG